MVIDFKELIHWMNNIFTIYLVFPGIILVGIYLSIKLRFVQLSKLNLSFKYLLASQRKEGGAISHYQTVSGILAGNFGTGNISGMAIALTTGGPGALAWMWVMAFFGAAIQYTSCILSSQYRVKNAKGEYVGGPMYYLSRGLGMKKMGVLFSIFAILAAFTAGEFVQVNSMTLPLKQFGFDPLYCGIFIAILLGFVIVGGMRRFARLASSLVPIMALFYLAAATCILVMHVDQLPHAFKLIFDSALHPQSLVGGVLGYGIFKAIGTGFERGLFATDAGTGLVPIIQASADTESPIISGLVTLITPFLVMLICTITGLVLIVTDVWQIPNLLSTNMCAYAFQKGLNVAWGGNVVIISLFLFAITTILAWGCCAEKAVEYLFGTRAINFFRYLFICMIPLGSVLKVDLVWLIADISISFMLIINMIGVIALSSRAIDDSKRFFAKKTLILNK